MTFEDLERNYDLFCTHCGERVSPMQQQEVILRLSDVNDPTGDIIDKFKAMQGACPCGHTSYQEQRDGRFTRQP